MNVLSLFDGMSCGRIALERGGIDVDRYYAAEIDKYAVEVSSINWPDTIQLGDVEKWREWDIDWKSIDYLIGGSPCQGFSFAGKQLAFDDPRSKLFFVYVDILNQIKSVNPNVKFLLENVKMKKDYLDAISQQLDVEPVLINSALVSAQNRQRFYWCNWSVEQPEDKGIELIDVIESDPSNTTYMSAKFVERQKGRKCLRDDLSGKAASLSAMEYVKNGRQGDYILVRKKSKCVRSSGRGSYDRHEWDSISDCHYRKLTPIECERLQTVPDNYTNHVSNTQRYKMLGNGWTVDVIAHILKQSVVVPGNTISQTLSIEGFEQSNDIKLFLL